MGGLGSVARGGRVATGGYNSKGFISGVLESVNPSNVTQGLKTRRLSFPRY